MHLLEAKLLRLSFSWAFLFAAPALLSAAGLPALDLLAWDQNMELNWSEFKISGLILSFGGFVAVGATLTNATFAYATASSDTVVTQELRQAAKSLYAVLISVVALIVTTFALNVYSIIINPETERPAAVALWYLVAGPGFVVFLACSLLMLLKGYRFARHLFMALKTDHQL